MMRSIRHLSAACLGLMLAACSSVPIHFHTLVPPASDTPAGTAADASYRIAVLPVTIPAQVDQPQLVVRQGQGSVALLEGQQWIAPLGDEIRTVVADELTRRLGAQDIYGIATSEGKPVYRIKLDIQRFESVPSQYTMLSAAWSVQPADGKGTTLQCNSTIRESVEPGYDALVVGHQQGLQALADKMAVAVRRLASGNDAHCPM